MIEQKFRLGQRVFILQHKGIFGPKWFGIEDILKYQEGKVRGVHNYGVTDAHGNPIIFYAITDEEGHDLPNHDELGRGEFRERDIYSTINDAASYLIQVVDEKIEELKEVKRELLNSIEEERRRKQPQYINEDLFDLSE